MKFLENLLRDRDLFASLTIAPDPIQVLKNRIGNFSTNPMSEYSDVQKWNIFTRIRFEYVRPTCTLRRLDLMTVAPTLTDQERKDGLLAYVLAGLSPNVSAVKTLHNAINNPVPGSVGEALKDYYASGVPCPGEQPSLFPVEYIVPHDLHHVLLGADISQAGEMQVLAFESGMCHRSEFPIMIIEQLEIFLGGLPFSSIEMMKAWNHGARVKALFVSWDWASELNMPLDEFRSKYA